jgi:hypothetical protein
MTGLTVGAFRIRRLEEELSVDGETAEKVACRGRGRFYTVSGDGLRLTVRDTSWDNGERDLVVAERHDSPQRFDTLVERLRLTVHRRGDDLYAELRQVRLKANGRGNLFSATEDELDAGAGVSVARELEQHGAVRVGTRAALLHDEGPSRGRLGVRFGEGAEFVPVVAYVCTRVGPVAKGIAA